MENEIYELNDDQRHKILMSAMKISGIAGFLEIYDPDEFGDMVDFVQSAGMNMGLLVRVIEQTLNDIEKAAMEKENERKNDIEETQEVKEARAGLMSASERYGAVLRAASEDVEHIDTN